MWLHASPQSDNLVVDHNRQLGCLCQRWLVPLWHGSVRDPNLALLLLGSYRKLVDAAVVGLARKGFNDVRPVHDFAMRAIAAGADSASELGRRLSVSKQAAAKTIATLVERGYVAREEDRRTAAASGSRSRPLGFEVLRTGEAIFDDVRESWAARRSATPSSRPSRPSWGVRRRRAGPVEAPGWVALELDGRWLAAKHPSTGSTARAPAHNEGWCCAVPPPVIRSMNADSCAESRSSNRAESTRRRSCGAFVP